MTTDGPSVCAGSTEAESPADRTVVHVDDASLVASIATREHAALEHAYRSHGGAVFGLARRLLVDHALAEEVTQEVFLRLWSRPHRFDSARGSLRAFLMADCHGRALDVVRAEASRRRREAHDAVIDVRDAQQSRDIATEVCAIEAAREIRSSLDCLPPDERLPIILAYYGAKTYSEVATLLQAPVGTVKSRIRRGLERLRTELPIDANAGPRAGP